MIHWTIWSREPGVREASLRRYGSKLVYHITVCLLFILVTVTCKYSTLTQLTYHFASYNNCSNWRSPTTMQAWHRRTRFCRTLTNIPGMFWIISQAATILPTNSLSVELGSQTQMNLDISIESNVDYSGQVTSQAMEQLPFQTSDLEIQHWVAYGLPHWREAYPWLFVRGCGYIMTVHRLSCVWMYANF